MLPLQLDEGHWVSAVLRALREAMARRARGV